MGNRKPPKKAPPNKEPSKTQNNAQDKQSVEQPTESLTVVEKDIGNNGSATESSNAQQLCLQTALAITRKETAQDAGLQTAVKEPKKASEEESPGTSGHTNDHEKERSEDTSKPKNSWADLVKGKSKMLIKRGEAFTLESGEACIRIPNSVIDRHKRAWDCFILGQFYTNPPSHGTIHNIVNGIWSRQYRDISVSKMSGQAFLFRIPSATTRQRVLTQRLWQIEGRTMFVDKWEPGASQDKPELTSAPIWLELRDVPLQYFNEEGLDYIASMVGEPKFLHPTTENKTNLEVAKVFTIIDPRKALPEAVNVQYETGEIRRIRVSSPWMPPVCEFCNEIGHRLRHCHKAPVKCSSCSSMIHVAENCPRRTAREQNKIEAAGVEVKRLNATAEPNRQLTPPPGKGSLTAEWREKTQDKEKGLSYIDKGKGITTGKQETKTKANEPRPQEKLVLGGNTASKSQNRALSRTAPEVPSRSEESSTSEDSRGTDSSDGSASGTEEGEFHRVLTQRQRKALRGRGLKHKL